jgi:large subunit ribosomal protein L17
MRHRSHSHSFGRRSGPKKALLKGLVISLVEHERIKTTLAKAKELRKHVEKAVTLSKDGDLAARRVLISRFGNQDTAEKLVTNLGKRFQDRKGGYTRILKMGVRPGDRVPMALIEFVDFKLPEPKGDDTKVVGDKDASKRSRNAYKIRLAARKRRRQMQANSRRANRK